MKTAKEYRAMARESLKGYWGKAAVTVLIYMATVIIPCVIYEWIQLKQQGTTLAGISIVVYIAFMFAIALPMAYALTISLLHLKRQSRNSPLQNMLETFSNHYGKAAGSYTRYTAILFLMTIPLAIVAVMLAIIATNAINGADLTSLQAFADGLSATTPEEISAMNETQIANMFGGNTGTFLGIYYACLLLMMIPVIIYSYSVNLFPYILEDYPEISLKEAFLTSKRMMYGHKWQMFCLDLSFIGWLLLEIITFGILSLWIQPYQSVAHAHFYDDLRRTECAVENSDDIKAVEEA